MVNQTRREFLKLGLAAAASAAMASGIEIPVFGAQNSSIKNQLTDVQTRVKTLVGFVSLSITEQSLLEKIVETIIPTDADPGAKEAGVIYFIDRQLAGDYGQSANMFMEGPFIPPKVPSTANLSVAPSPSWVAIPAPAGGGGNAAAISYPGGTASPRVGSGINYQYPLNLRSLWKTGLEAVQNYSKNTAPYLTTFQKLSATNQLQLLADLWAGTPTSFADDHGTSISPVDFAYELSFMTWAGFTMDPLYGGNQNMVGWQYMGFNGVNLGNAYGEGLSQKDLMIATTPTRLKPASLAQYQ